MILTVHVAWRSPCFDVVSNLVMVSWCRIFALDQYGSIMINMDQSFRKNLHFAIPSICSKCSRACDVARSSPKFWGLRWPERLLADTSDTSNTCDIPTHRFGPRRFLICWCSRALFPWGAKGALSIPGFWIIVLHTDPVWSSASKILTKTWKTIQTYSNTLKYQKHQRKNGCPNVRFLCGCHDPDHVFAQLKIPFPSRTCEILADHHLDDPRHNASRQFGSIWHCKFWQIAWSQSLSLILGRVSETILENS